VVAGSPHRQLLDVLADGLRADRSQEAQVLLGVEAGHLLESGRLRAVDGQLLVQPIVDDQVVRHANAMWLPGGGQAQARENNTIRPRTHAMAMG